MISQSNITSYFMFRFLEMNQVRVLSIDGQNEARESRFDHLYKMDNQNEAREPRFGHL